MSEAGGRRLASAVRWLWWVIVAVLLIGAARTAWYAVGPPSEGHRTAAQVAWLNSAISASDASERMQRLFPEGAAFTLALTALATGAVATESAGANRAALLGELEQRNVDLRSDSVVADYPPAAGLDHGIFLAGWQLHVQLALARLTGRPSDVQTAVEGARRIIQAVDAADQPFLEAYPGQVWPADTVVAIAAVADVDLAFTVPGARVAVQRWVDRARPPGTEGLLAHHVALDGTPLDGPRGSSGALALTFLARIDRSWATEAWRAFRARFVTGVAGAVGVREFEKGSGRSGDVDSGPLLAGVSLSASAVGVAAARANGDARLADDLLRQAEIVGLPVDLLGKRRYALGVVPVGDAFLAWARSVARGPELSGGSPHPWWWLWMTPWFLAVVALTAARPRVALRPLREPPSRRW